MHVSKLKTIIRVKTITRIYVFQIALEQLSSLILTFICFHSSKIYFTFKYSEQMCYSQATKKKLMAKIKKKRPYLKIKDLEQQKQNLANLRNYFNPQDTKYMQACCYSNKLQQTIKSSVIASWSAVKSPSDSSVYRVSQKVVYKL